MALAEKRKKVLSKVEKGAKMILVALWIFMIVTFLMAVIEARPK